MEKGPQGSKFLCIYNNLLESYLSVLSSLSSQILHQVFYEVISTHIFVGDLAPELKVYLLKIAEKIIAICQGDLLLIPNLMQMLTAPGEKLMASAQTLWLRSKIFPNYPPKGRMASRETILSILLDIISLLASDKMQEEKSLIRVKAQDCIEMYILVNPLLFWLDFALESESRLPLFRLLWDTLSQVLTYLKDTVDLDFSNLLLPMIGKVNEHCKHSTPSLPMLKFLDIVLKYILKITVEMKDFLLEFIANFSRYLPKTNLFLPIFTQNNN